MKNEEVSDEEMARIRRRSHDAYRIAMNARNTLKRWKEQGDLSEQARAEALGRRTRILLNSLKLKRDFLRAKCEY